MLTDLIDVEKIDEAKSSLRWFILWPQKWQSFTRDLSSYTWQEYEFNEATANNIPTEVGVYCFVIKPNIANHPACSYLMYIGQTTDQNLRKRFKQYLKEKDGTAKSRPKVRYILQKYEGYLHFICMPLNGDVTPKEVEDELINAYIPPVNDKLPSEISKIVKAIFI